mmetsp:Transcript_9913/g.21992  ORF Transcript_9913/g.21992 Transcript_9913/m.21992 type:complete len:231 (-) Transcript_9913:415-1107(-)
MALVGLGACVFTICSTHGFLPHAALGYAADSPMLANVKCDVSRMASNVASGVGFIGAGAIYRRKDNENIVSGLTTSAAIWVSASVGVSSAVGMYFVALAASLSTVAILKFARVPKEEDPPFVWKPRPLDVVDGSREYGNLSGLFGKSYEQYSSQEKRSHDAKRHERVILSQAIDPHLEQYLQSKSKIDQDEVISVERPSLRESKVLIEEEQEVISTEMDADNDRDSVFRP